jgi:hypothetical protein
LRTSGINDRFWIDPTAIFRRITLQFPLDATMFRYFVRLASVCAIGANICFASQPAIAEPVVPANNIRPQNTSYIGVGGSIGLSGNTSALGTGGFAILTKVGFSEHLSLHDATVLFGNGAATSMIILTAELPIRDRTGQTIISPFLGGGAAIRYQNGLIFSPAISGGVDLPLSQNFTGTMRLNVAFPSDRHADVGVLIGAGYNLGG